MWPLGPSGEGFRTALVLVGWLVIMAKLLPWSIYHTLFAMIIFAPTILYVIVGLVLAMYGLGSMHTFRFYIGVAGVGPKNMLHIVIGLRSINLQPHILHAINKGLGKKIPINITGASSDNITISLSLEDVSE